MIAHRAPGAGNVAATARRMTIVAAGGNINIETIGINEGESIAEERGLAMAPVSL